MLYRVDYAQKQHCYHYGFERGNGYVNQPLPPIRPIDCSSLVQLWGNFLLPRLEEDEVKGNPDPYIDKGESPNGQIRIGKPVYRSCQQP